MLFGLISESMNVKNAMTENEYLAEQIQEKLKGTVIRNAVLSEDGEELEATLANADEVRRPDQGSWRAGPHSVRRNTSRPSWHPRCHPRDTRVIPKSRDFH